MKISTKIFPLIFVISLMITLTSCNKVSHNGALDGQWQIMTIENLSSGEVNSEENTPGEVTTPETGKYICINLHVLQLRSISGVISANMTYDKDAGTIDADFPYVTRENISSQLSPFGINANPVRLSIMKLSHNELILKTDSSIITCRKF